MPHVLKKNKTEPHAAADGRAAASAHAIPDGAAGDAGADGAGPDGGADAIAADASSHDPDADGGANPRAFAAMEPAGPLQEPRFPSLSEPRYRPYEVRSVVFFACKELERA